MFFACCLCPVVCAHVTIVWDIPWFVVGFESYGSEVETNHAPTYKRKIRETINQRLYLPGNKWKFPEQSSSEVCIDSSFLQLEISMTCFRIFRIKCTDKWLTQYAYVIRYYKYSRIRPTTFRCTLRRYIWELLVATKTSYSKFTANCSI